MFDAMTALRSLVLDEVAIAAILDESTTDVSAADRVFVNRIPEAAIKASDTFHPPKMIVLRQAGGTGRADNLPIEDLRVQVLTYGESDFEANRVRMAVYKAFKGADRACFDSVLIHHINPAGGPVPLVDPDIVWSAMSQAFTLKADTEEAA